MAKFIKENSVPEVKNQTKKQNPEREIMSPLYFPPPDDRINQKEVAEMFGRTVQTVCNWTKKNKIPYFRLGDLPIYSRKRLIIFSSKNQELLK